MLDFIDRLFKIGNTLWQMLEKSNQQIDFHGMPTFIWLSATNHWTEARLNWIGLTQKL